MKHLPWPKVILIILCITSFFPNQNFAEAQKDGDDIVLGKYRQTDPFRNYG